MANQAATTPPGWAVPDQSILHQLTELIRNGNSPIMAADAVLTPYRPTPLAEFVWPALLAAAQRISRNEARVIENRALAPAAREANQKARLQLPTTVFRVGGEEIRWGTATVPQHEARIAWQLGQIQGITTDVDRHKAAIQLIQTSRRARCLNDIPDWPEKLAEALGQPSTAEPAEPPQHAPRSRAIRRRPVPPAPAVRPARRAS